MNVPIIPFQLPLPPVLPTIEGNVDYRTFRDQLLHIDQLLDALPEMRLAVPVDGLTWRPGPFHRALVALPVTFPESPPLNVF